MYLIPAYWVAISLALVGIGWILYAQSQDGRFQSKVLIWLSLPFFVVAVVYLWFTFFDVDIAIRAGYARTGFVVIAIPQGIVLIVLAIISFMNNKKGGKHGPE